MVTSIVGPSQRTTIGASSSSLVAGLFVLALSASMQAVHAEFSIIAFCVQILVINIINYCYNYYYYY